MALSLSLAQPATLQGQSFRVGYALTTRTQDTGRRRWSEPEPDAPTPDPVEPVALTAAPRALAAAHAHGLARSTPSELELRFRAGQLFGARPAPSA